MSRRCACLYLILGLCMFLLVPKLLQWASSVFQIHNASSDAIFGRWEQSITLPLVPAAVALLPRSAKVLVWAADSGKVFNTDPEKPGRTVTLTFDLNTRTITERSVSTTNHNMFCPGLSIDSTGRPIITGGSSAERTSIYNEVADIWISGPNMTLGRGYHAQTTLSDGRIFTIGGSWAGLMGEKNGEVYDPISETWSRLPGCLVSPMLTNDERGVFCSDNHAWLFGWKNGSVFQAGPSRAMNWYATGGDGGHSSAGFRANDSDSMNGNAVMYDAVNGKILTLGGSPGYTASYGTGAAHIITIAEQMALANVEVLRPMHYPRVFANSVILPTGEVFINGGQSYARQWTDVNATLIPELWSPETRRFNLLARMPIPRTYHSVAILLPDATVLTGGGGLCWASCADESANHLDIQVFTPPYLFDSSNALAIRPQIVAVSDTTVAAGASLTISMDGKIKEFSLLRYGSATHSINTDQRRISLEAVHVKKTRAMYEIKIPEDTGVALPGYWMLFAVNNEGVPSIARTILIEGASI